MVKAKLLLEVRITEVFQVTSEHLNFIIKHSGGHITSESYQYYAHKGEGSTPCPTSELAIFVKKPTSLGEDILLESRLGANLVGISFAPILIQSYSITVVRQGFRNVGIGTAMLRLKDNEVLSRGHFLLTGVAKSNAQSIRMCTKVFERQIDQGRRYIFTNQAKEE